MSTWLLWRLLKFLGLAAFAGGALGLWAVPSRSRRLELVYRWATPGFMLTWIAGWMLMKATDLAPHEPWLLMGMVLSFAALHMAFLASHKEQVRAVTHGLILGSLLASVAVMVLRTGSLGLQLGGAVLSLVVGAILVGRGAREELDCAEDDLRTALGGFAWVAWAEGLSYVVLLGIAVPLRVAAGIDLDGDSGLLGWIHGVLFVVYLQALSSTGKLLGWSMRDRAVGFVAGLLPFGTFVFERRMAKRL